MRSARLAAFHVCCVLVFVMIGRASHTKGEALAGDRVHRLAVPGGLGGRLGGVPGLAASLAIRPAGWRDLAVHGDARHGLAGRVRPGDGAAFIVVALAFLGLFLLGWRLLARLAGATGRRYDATLRLS